MYDWGKHLENCSACASYVCGEDIRQRPDERILVLVSLTQRRGKLDMAFQDPSRQNCHDLFQGLRKSRLRTFDARH